MRSIGLKPLRLRDVMIAIAAIAIVFAVEAARRRGIDRNLPRIDEASEKPITPERKAEVE